MASDKKGWVEKLAELLDESGMQVTMTGWKAELEATEKELNKLVVTLQKVEDFLAARLDKSNEYDDLYTEVHMALKKVKGSKGINPTNRFCTGNCMTCKGRCADNAERTR